MAEVLLRAVARTWVVEVGCPTEIQVGGDVVIWLIGMSLELLRREKAP